jgi:hypothetical protein
MDDKIQQHQPAAPSHEGSSQELTTEAPGGLEAMGPDGGPALQRQQAANLSPQVSQLRSLQAALNSSSQVQQLRKTQEAATSVPVQRKENKTGMPDGLKSGIESLSGMAMDDVKVHYNSDKPADMQAHAYAQGSDIHLAPGQEQHLPHEAWHVVQQRQGRVQPTTQVGGAAVNDDAGLEGEADRMGSKALQMKADDAPAPVSQLKFAGGHATGCCCGGCTGGTQPAQRKAVVQRVKLTKEDVKLWEDTINSEIESGLYNNNQIQQWYNLFNWVDTDTHAKDVESEYNKLMGNSTHASGYAHANGMLYPAYFDIRACFFPKKYDNAASQNRDTIVGYCTDPVKKNLWQCPECNQACDKNVWGEDVTIDHVVDCATYWNNQGRDDTKQNRENFYNNTANHDIMCRSCNSKKNSGGTKYRRMVGTNFRH